MNFNTCSSTESMNLSMAPDNAPQKGFVSPRNLYSLYIKDIKKRFINCFMLRSVEEKNHYI